MKNFLYLSVLLFALLLCLAGRADVFPVGGGTDGTFSLPGSTGAGSGDVVGPSSSVDGEVVLFDLTSGKLIKAATSTGYGYVTSGVFSVKSGTSAQYLRADGTVSTLNTDACTEATNLYFTNARAIAATLTAYSSGAGTVSSSDSILQAIQKLNGNDGLKLNVASPSWTGTMTTPLTASRAMVTDGSSQLAASATTSTELGYVSGVTSAIQTQLNAKVTSTGMVEDLHGYIATAADTTYPLIAKNRVARQVTKFAAKCGSGSITAKLQIGGVDITTCTAMSITTTVSDATCNTGSSNDLASGGRLTLVTSSNSACTGFEWSIETTRD